MQRYIASPSELIHKQKEEISRITSQLNSFDQLIINSSAELKNIQEKLPFLKGEINRLENSLPPLQMTSRALRETAAQHELAFSNELQAIAQNEQKISALEKEKNDLLVQHEKAKQAWMYTKHIFENKGDFYFAKMASKRTDLGIGMDIIDGELGPGTETLMLSIEDKIHEKEDAIKAARQEGTKIDQNAFAVLDQETDFINQTKVMLAQFAAQIKLLKIEVDERSTLKKIAEENTLQGVSVRGEQPSFTQLQSANRKDRYGKNALYYACRCRHVDLAIQLLDFTKLTKAEEDGLVHSLPKDDKNAYTGMLSAIKNKNTYDSLWNDKASLGDNIQQLFEDYISPKFLKQFDFISDAGKRILTFNWNRKYLDIAQDIVTIFSKLEPDLKQKKSLCQMLIGGKWDAFFNQNPDPNDPFARRLYYVKNKLELQKKQASQVSVSNLGLLSSPKMPKNTIEMRQITEQTATQKPII